MCPSLAEPDWGGFPKRIVFSYKPQANKSFSVQQFFKNAAEVWASSPHLRSKLNFATCFLCCNCIFKSCPIQTKWNHENQGCKFRQGNGAIAACWQAKAGVDPPFAECYRSVSLRAFLHCFMWNAVLRKTICVRFGRIASLSAFVLFAGVALSELLMNLS